MNTLSQFPDTTFKNVIVKMSQLYDADAINTSPQSYQNMQKQPNTLCNPSIQM